MNKKINITSILNNATSLTDIFLYYERYFPNVPFLFKKSENKWKGQNFKKTGINVRKIFNFFKDLGLRKGDRVFLLSSNRVEWVEFDLAIMIAGAITVPSFVTNNCEDNKYIIMNCKPKIIIFENEITLKNNKKIFTNFDRSKVLSIEKSKNFIDYDRILKKGKKKTEKIKVQPSDIATIIYTSGTGGNPKGVVLQHKALLHNLAAALELLKEFDIDNERFISFLPLSHSYERMAGLYFPLLINAQIYFCSSLDKLFLEIKEVKPTIFSAVPRLYENIYKKIKSKIKSGGKFEKILMSMFFQYVENRTRNFLINILGWFFLKFVLQKKIKDNFGGKIKVLISGGAALSPQIGSFFNKIGFCLLQGYGQTEAAPLISCNKKKLNDSKTVGFPVKNVDVKISNENEILVKGENVMLGYWENKKLTNKTILNKWLHTGDLGFFDNIGRLVINGRKKDLIVTSGGDNISVQKIETLLTQQIEIEQAIVIGDNRPYLAAILISDKKNSYQKLRQIINLINQELNSIEKIRKFLVFHEPFTYEKGLLTQTHKIKRKVIIQRFQKEIESLYTTLK